MSDAAASLAAARADLGYSESPPGSNRTKFGKWYGADGQPWCDMAQSYWADKAGNASAVGRFAYTPSHAAWFQSRGQWHTGRDVRVGDLVFYNFGAGRIHHVGLVEAVRSDGIVAVEGNTSSGSDANGGQVQRRFRSWSVGIVGYGRPAYSASSGGLTVIDAATKKYLDGKFGAVEHAVAAAKGRLYARMLEIERRHKSADLTVDPADIKALADDLRKTLGPDIAAELARRLAK